MCTYFCRAAGIYLFVRVQLKVIVQPANPQHWVSGLFKEVGGRVVPLDAKTNTGIGSLSKEYQLSLVAHDMFDQACQQASFDKHGLSAARPTVHVYYGTDDADPQQLDLLAQVDGQKVFRFEPIAPRTSGRMTFRWNKIVDGVAELAEIHLIVSAAMPHTAKLIIPADQGDAQRCVIGRMLSSLLVEVSVAAST